MNFVYLAQPMRFQILKRRSNRRTLWRTGCGFIGRERAACLDRFADHPVHDLDGIRGVYDFPNCRIEGKKRDHLLPCSPPGRGDGGVFPSPFFLEGIKFGLNHLGGHGAVNLAQARGHDLTFCLGEKVQGMAYQMRDAGLDHRHGRSRRDPPGKPFSPSTTAIRIPEARGFSIAFITESQNFAPSISVIHRPKTSR